MCILFVYFLNNKNKIKTQCSVIIICIHSPPLLGLHKMRTVTVRAHKRSCHLHRAFSSNFYDAWNKDAKYRQSRSDTMNRLESGSRDDRTDRSRQPKWVQPNIIKEQMREQRQQRSSRDIPGAGERYTRETRSSSSSPYKYSRQTLKETESEVDPHDPTRYRTGHAFDINKNIKLTAVNR